MHPPGCDAREKPLRRAPSAASRVHRGPEVHVRWERHDDDQSGADPAPRAEARTYEVRTYGCQMNVHDSERLAGLLEDAGYVAARAATSTADVVVFNTCAVRENADNKLYGNLGHLAPVKAREPGHADRRRRLPGAEGPRRRSSAGRPGSTSSSAPTTSARCRCCSSGPGSQRGGAGRDPRVARGLPVDAADPARVGVRRLGVDLRRLQQHLHVLHRPGAARQGEGPPARRRSSPRSRRWSPRACIEVTLLGQNVNAYGVEFGDRQRVRQAAAGLRRGRGPRAGPLHLPAPGGLHRRRDRGDGRDART